LFVTVSPTACEDGERHDLFGGVLRVVAGMVQSKIDEGDSLESRRPCALQACRSQTDPAPQSRKPGTQERVRRTA